MAPRETQGCALLMLHRQIFSELHSFADFRQLSALGLIIVVSFQLFVRAFLIPALVVRRRILGNFFFIVPRLGLDDIAPRRPTTGSAAVDGSYFGWFLLRRQT